MEPLSIALLCALILVILVGAVAVLILLWQRTKLKSRAAEAEARADALLPLKKYEAVVSAEAEASRLLAAGHEAAAAVRAEAVRIKESAVATSEKLSKEATQILETARTDAAGIVSDAHKRAKEIAADAYEAKRTKDDLERAANAMRNIIEGYGEKYIIPGRSLLDDLSEDFSHTDAGRKLALARANTKNMVKLEQAAFCDYKEENRRAQAIKFVLDSFNAKTDSILTGVEKKNFGVLDQQIVDAYAFANHFGAAFRNARISEEYLKSRREELRWAIIVVELKEKEREEQRAIKERLREEQKAQKEYERALRDAQKNEDQIRKAIEKAREEANAANESERDRLQEQVALLTLKLKEAEEKNQRALSMAQQTKAGHIYIISNIGSFGEEVFKIGMTRRLEPMDRIWELGDASVPFDFDVHALFFCDDAPAFEAKLHRAFDDLRVNKVNFKKEFFRIPGSRIKQEVEKAGVQATFTLLAEAREFRESLAISHMNAEEQARYYDNARKRSPLLPASASITSRRENSENED